MSTEDLSGPLALVSAARSAPPQGIVDRAFATFDGIERERFDVMAESLADAALALVDETLPVLAAQAQQLEHARHGLRSQLAATTADGYGFVAATARGLVDDLQQLGVTVEVAPGEVAALLDVLEVSVPAVPSTPLEAVEGDGRGPEHPSAQAVSVAATMGSVPDGVRLSRLRRAVLATERQVVRDTQRFATTYASVANRAAHAHRLEAPVRLSTALAEVEEARRLGRRQIFEAVATDLSCLLDLRRHLEVAEETPWVAPPPITSRPDSSAWPQLAVHADWAALNGLGVAARRLTLGLLAAGAQLTRQDFASGAPQVADLVPDAIGRLEQSGAPAVHLWTANIGEWGLVPPPALRPEARPQYNIATWYYELPELAPFMPQHLAQIDELWVPSAFVAQAFAASATCPIVEVVPPIELPVPSTNRGARRAALGVDDAEVVVLVSFSAASGVARKNPFGAIEAVRRARQSPEGRNLRLVVKVHDLDTVPGVEASLRSALAAVDGLLVCDRGSDQEVIDLLAAADLYLSLHRSEGLGLGLAESMLLGVPVVATAFSGNLAFMDARCAALVGYSLCSVTAEELSVNPGLATVYPPGTAWAEPDLDQAAAWLAALAADPQLRGRLGTRGRAVAAAHFSQARFAATVAARLDALGVR